LSNTHPERENIIITEPVIKSNARDTGILAGFGYIEHILEGSLQ
jgi:hypothetical protein